MSKSAEKKKKKDVHTEISTVETPEAEVAEKPAAELSPEEKIAQLQDKYLRAMAELDNFKKRTERDKAELAAFIKIGLFRDILSVVDDFDRFFHHVEASRAELDRSFVEGVELIHKSLVKVLEKYNVEALDQAGVRVDYHQHEAVLTVAVDDREKDHTVVEVLEVGYRIGDRLIRPAKVKVGVFSG